MEYGHIRTKSLIIVTLAFRMAMRTPLPRSPQIPTRMCPTHPLIASTLTINPTSIEFVASYRRRFTLQPLEAPRLLHRRSLSLRFQSALSLVLGPPPNAEHSFCQRFMCTASDITSTALLGDLGAWHGSKWDTRTTLNCYRVYFFFLRWLRTYLCVF